ncbi:MAG: hypothetical protein M0R06_22335 [Sphaerochaeta sp.]|jgi:uncharacterized membrane protein|nr:hypothetical protein [Sphaerochaeta sp.]
MNIEVPVLTVGITQIVKYFAPGLSDRGKIAVAMCVGVVLLTAQELLTSGALGDAAVVVETAVRIIAGAIAVPGLFGVLKDDLLPAIGTMTS